MVFRTALILPAVLVSILLPPVLAFAGLQSGGAPKTTKHFIEHNGFERMFLMALPERYSPEEPAPLVLAFHGSGQTAKSFSRKRKDLFRKASDEGMILVFPQSTDAGGRTRWITEGEPPEFSNIDDLGFILKIIDGLKNKLAIDSSRVYATGFSNGGNFTHYLASKTEGVFAAVAPVATGIGSQKGMDEPIIIIPPPQEAIPIMMVNGKLDTSRPYDGGRNKNGMLVTSVADAVAFWVGNNQCESIPQTVSSSNGTVIIDRYNRCAEESEVVMVTLELMHHQWPDKREGFNFDANQEIIEFFKRHHN